MLSLVEVTNAYGQVLSLPLTQLGTGYIVTDIQGLGPVKADIATSKFANLKGVQFQSASQGARNITMKLGFEPDYEVESVQSMRQALYSWFSTGMPVELRFTVGRFNITDIAYKISGYVESAEPSIFSKDPEMDISIICPLPDFLDTAQVIFNDNSTSTATEIPLVYTGTTDTGVLFTLYPNRDLTDLSLNVRGPDGVLRTLSFTDDLNSGDILTINTGQGVKSVTRTHLSVETNLIQKVPAVSTWIQLKPGTNLVRVAISGAAVPYTLTYRNAYGGL